MPKVRPQIIKSIGVGMCFLPMELFVAGHIWGFNVFDVNTHPLALLFTILVAAASPFFMFLGKGRTNIFLWTLLLCVLTLMQVYIFALMNYQMRC
jgi:hypothetical protein